MKISIQTKESIKNIKFRIYYLTIFKIKTFIRRKLSIFFKFNRPSSYPFITGDSFRSLATHVYDELQDLKPAEVMENDIVFVRSDFLHTYFKKIHPKIKNKYILLSHNSDENINSDFEKYIDDRIIHWFAQNLMIENQKCTPLPIGLQLRLYDKKNRVIKNIQQSKNNNGEKINKIFYAFSEETNPKRSEALKYLNSNDIAIKSNKKLNVEEYYKIVSEYVFNASPEGGGVDCHRTWETLYLRSIPVLEKSINSEYWKKIGLPVLIINSWEDINNFNENILSKKYFEIKEKMVNSPLYMEYWIKEIYDKKIIK